MSPGRDLTNLEKGPAKKRRRTDSGVSGTGAKAIKGKYSVVVSLSYRRSSPSTGQPSFQ